MALGGIERIKKTPWVIGIESEIKSVQQCLPCADLSLFG